MNIDYKDMYNTPPVANNPNYSSSQINNSFSNSNSNNAATSRHNKFSVYLKLIVCSIVVIVSGINSVTNMMQMEKEPKCIEDIFLVEMSPLHEYLKLENNKLLRNIIVIVVIGILDLNLVVLSLLWIFRGKNWKPILNILLFYILRLFCNFIFIVKNNEDMIWEYTGVPSLTASFSKGDNFFFSGIVGLYLILTLELYEFNYKFMSVLSSIGLVAYIILCFTLKCDYFFSIFCGFVSAHYFHIVSKKYHHWMNYVYDFNHSVHKRGNREKNNSITNSRNNSNININKYQSKEQIEKPRPNYKQLSKESI